MQGSVRKEIKRVAVIGGSGVYKLAGLEVVRRHECETPFGKPTSAIIEGALSVGGERFTAFFLARHGEGHCFSPSEVNYRANIFALKSLGVDGILSVSAVGSLKEELAPGTFVLPDQFIDWTKGVRKRSFFGEGMVGHVSAAKPIECCLQDALEASCKKANIQYARGGSYVCIEGPQFSSKAESAIYRSFGASVIGMTNVPESYLAKEAGMAYATVAMVTDYDCWKEVHCSVEEIMKVVHQNVTTVQRLIETAIPHIYQAKLSFNLENGNCVMTDPKLLSSKNQEILAVLTR